ncbi:MAG TPA: hypothetical protein PKW59_12090 [Thermotogota bacterium]|nr:hypothetical protein [Thermotogota bacterium]
MAKQVISIKDIAERWKVKDVTVRELLGFFRIQYSQKSGATYLYSMEVVEKLFEKLADIKMTISQ